MLDINRLSPSGIFCLGTTQPGLGAFISKFLSCEGASYGTKQLTFDAITKNIRVWSLLLPLDIHDRERYLSTYCQPNTQLIICCDVSNPNAIQQLEEAFNSVKVRDYFGKICIVSTVSEGAKTRYISDKVLSNFSTHNGCEYFATLAEDFTLSLEPLPKELKNAENDKENNDPSLASSSEEFSSDQSLNKENNDSSVVSSSEKFNSIQSLDNNYEELGALEATLAPSALSEFPEKFKFALLANSVVVQSYNETYECAKDEFNEANENKKKSLKAFAENLNSVASSCNGLLVKQNEYTSNVNGSHPEHFIETHASKVENSRGEINQVSSELSNQLNTLEISLQPLIPTIPQTFAFVARRLIRIVAEVFPILHYPIKLVKTIISTEAPQENSTLSNDSGNSNSLSNNRHTLFQSANLFTKQCNETIETSRETCNQTEKSNDALDFSLWHKFVNWF